MSTVDSTTSTSSSSSSSSSGTSTIGSYDTWLQILATTMQNQNPLDPSDTNELMAQLTSYSQLEQQIGINDKMDDVISALDSSGFASGVSYLGHSITADTDTLSVEDDGTVDATWNYDLSSSAKSVTLTVVNSDGDTVYTTTGDTTAGSHSFAWDGTDSDGEAVSAGEYTLQVTATNSAGKSISSSISINGTVTAIDSSSGSTVLELGDTSVSIDDVTRLEA